MMKTMRGLSEEPGATTYNEVYRIDGPLDLTGLWELYKLPGFEKFHDKPHTPRRPPAFRQQRDIFSNGISRGCLGSSSV